MGELVNPDKVIIKYNDVELIWFEAQFFFNIGYKDSKKANPYFNHVWVLENINLIKIVHKQFLTTM